MIVFHCLVFVLQGSVGVAKVLTLLLHFPQPCHKRVYVVAQLSLAGYVVVKGVLVTPGK